MELTLGSREALFDLLPAAVFVTDEQGNYVEVNRAAIELLGWSRDEFLGMHASDLTAADDEQHRVEVRSMIEGGSWSGKVDLRHRDGSVRTVQLQASTVASDGSVYQVGVGFEIGLSERQLRSPDRLLAAIVDSTEDAIFAKDLDGTILSWNDGAEHMYGYRADEIVGRHVSTLAAESKHAEIDGFLERIAHGEPVRGHETERWTKDGRRIWVSLTVSPVTDEDDTIVAASTIARDITHRKLIEADLRTARDQLAIITENVGAGITIQSTDGRVIYANRAAAELSGFADAESFLAADPAKLAERFEIMDEEGEPFPWEQLPGRRALAGEAEAEAVLRVLDRESGDESWRMVRADPVTEPDGGVLFAVNIFSDITAERTREVRQRFLLEASRVLSSSLDYQDTLTKVADLAVSSLADWTSVEIVDDDGAITPLAIGHRDPDMVKWAWELKRRFPTDPAAPTGVPNVIRTGQSEMHPDVGPMLDEALATIDDQEVAEHLKALQLRSLIMVPLAARGRVFGAMSFVLAATNRRYSDEDLRLAEDLAARAALAIDNARTYQERDEIARILQQSLLPPSLPKVPGLTIAARYLASGSGVDVGGDFYDVFPTGDRGWGLTLGDVCGKGPAAAALMGVVRYTLRTAAMSESRPSEVLELLNEAILAQSADGRFCTVAYVRALLTPDGARLTVCSGGHPLPIVLRADGTVETLGHFGTLIGVFSDITLTDHAVDLRDGDTLVMYTDGVTDEQKDGEEFGEERLHEVLATLAGRAPDEIAGAIEQAVKDFLGAEPRDDVAVLVARAGP